jgi:hypothetical protein
MNFPFNFKITDMPFGISNVKKAELGEITYTEVSVDLISDDWLDNEQTLTIPGLTENSDVVVYPPVDRTDFLAYGDAQISAISIGNDSITFACTTTPVININNVIILWR